MPRRTSIAPKWLGGLLACMMGFGPAPAHAGAAMGNATEFTQLANNAQLIDLMKSSGIQVDNQLRQIGQLAEQIENQLKIYQNMLQNTARLPDHIWARLKATSINSATS